MDILIFIFEIIGTVAFSVSGVITALSKKMDLLGVVFMGFTTAVGGGVIRDIILGQTPPKAFINPIYSVIAILISVMSFFILKNRQQMGDKLSHTRVFLIMDSIGLAVFTVVGVKLSQDIYGFNPLLGIFMGVLTGVGGGVMRDLFSCRIPCIFTKHFYAMTSIIGSVVYIIIDYFSDAFVAGIIGMISVFLLRMFASKFMWNLPKAE